MSAEPGQANPHLPLVLGASLFALVLLALVVALMLVFSLRSDVAVLEDQARKSAKATKAMQEEIESLKEYAATLAAQRHAQPRAQNIDAADTSADCVIGSGGGRSGLPECMRLGADK